MHSRTELHDRAKVIQALIDARRATTYLEIGVQSGDTFFWIKAGKKLAVDPMFLFGALQKLRWMRWNRYNLFNKYYQMTSDAFFARNSERLASRRLDVVFVDGLHTFDQSLRDIEHSLRLLANDGIIIVDDCLPPNEQASLPRKPPGSDAWCGDVWKSIVYLRSTRPDLRIVTLECAYGLAVITNGSPEGMLGYSRDEIEAMSYDDLTRNRDHLLNVKKCEYLAELTN